MSVDLNEIRQVRESAEELYSNAQVQTALDRMGRELTEVYIDRNPILVCVMNGGIVITSELMRRLDFLVQVDYLHATRYRGDTMGRELHWLTRPRIPMEGRSVLVVDDILDEGVTLRAIMEHCRMSGAWEVESVVLVQKRHGRRVDAVRAGYVGLEVGDRYVFGYGMDYKGYLRNAAGIYAVAGM